MQVVNLSDKYRGLQNSLKVAGLAGAELTAVYKTLTAQAERNFAPVEAMVGLFSSTSQAAKDLGASTQDILKFTNVVAQAMRIAGTSPEAASGALLQLGQMLGSSRVQAEEFNSVAEGIRPLMQAAADGIDEAGGSISKLKQLVAAGQVSNKAFFEGAQVGAQAFETKLASSTTTVGGSLTNVRTALTNLVGAIDNASGFSDDLVAGFENLTSAIKATENLIGKFSTEFAAAGRFLDGVKAKVDYLADAIGRLTGLKIIGETLSSLAGLSDGNEMAGLKAQASVEALERGIASLTARKAELNKVMGDNPNFATTLTAMGQEIDRATAKLDTMRRAAAGAGLGGTAQAIMDATPVADLPGFSMPAEKSGAKRISLADYKVDGGVDKAAERQSNRIKELISDLEEEIRVSGLSAVQQEVSANLRRVNADAASKEGRQIAALTMQLERQRQAARDRDDDLRSQQSIRASQQDLNLMMAGAGVKAIEATRYAREKLFEIERQAAENGAEWARQRVQGLQQEAALVGTLAEKAKQADLYRDAIFERQNLGRSEAEQGIYSRMNSAGLLNANGEMEGPINNAIAAQMRFNDQLREAQQIAGDFTTGFFSDLRNGVKWTQALGNQLGKLGEDMMNQALRDLSSKAVSTLMGGGPAAGLGFKRDGSSANNALFVTFGGVGSNLPFDAGPSLLNQKMGGFGARRDAVADAGGWLKYANQGATRSQPLDPKLTEAFSFLKDRGIQMEVFSGGQPGKGSGLPRVGSTRHDHGMAADVFFSKDGRRLDWANPQDQPIFQDIVSQARANGVTGFGAGPGYMQRGSMHVGFGSPGVWGAGGRGANAPGWLREAYNSPGASQLPQALKQSTQQVQDFTANLNPATQGLGTFGQGLGQFGNALSGVGGQGGGAGILGGIFSLFSGFAGLFDEGGSIGAGKWGIAGERGLELVRGPASVTSRRETLAMIKRPSLPGPSGGGSRSSSYRGGDIIIQGNVDKNTMPDLEAAMARNRREMADQARYDRENSWRFE
ncbi:tape measure protein [Chenggangzhangella methanolivorans]|uniref:tape measure protein n=1 Tax=Chenggangzhangella methanolivorans TaxID=1437009 RepID=UPI003607105E